MLPGSYIARDIRAGSNPGRGSRAHLARVADRAECVEAAQRIRATREDLRRRSSPLRNLRIASR